MKQLEVAYVSGGATGIGAAIDTSFVQQGARVAIGDVQLEKAEQTAESIRKQGGEAIAISHDVSDEQQWIAALNQTVETFGRLDVLINNAAIIQICPLIDVEQGDIERLMSINVTGTILGHKHAIRIMRPGGKVGQGGSIINLSSVGGQIGTPALSVYSASKGAVRLLSKSAAVECGRFGYGIRVNSIYPGLVGSDMGNKLVDDMIEAGVFPDRATADEIVLGGYPIGRTGEPQDIVGAAVFLASEQSSWMTGAELVVDGGMTSH
ncbi:MAG: glucose 1-dehydrogenase [Motiliproteus sp.]